MTDYEHLLDLDEDDDLPAAMIELERIPRRLWEDALAPLPSRERAAIAERVRDPRLHDLALRLAAELDMADGRRRIAAAEQRFNARRRGAAPLPGV